MAQYNNTVLSLTREATPDPYMIYAHNRFFFTFTAGDRVEVWSANSLTGFYDHPEKHVIWRPPPDTDHSGALWAPEIHCLHDRWYVYVAAEDPKHGNKSHRMYVLGGPPAHQDPTQGPWEYLGPIQNMNNKQWAIDGTVVELDGQLYFIYSGWPFDNPTESDLIQRLYILRLQDPLTATSEAVEICRPQEGFEHSGDHRINEGPQYLASPDGSWRGIVYSCAGSWTKDYKMNTLKFLGGNALDPKSWQKSMTPLIQTGTHGKGPWGPGHGSFLDVGNDIVSVYHATDRPDDGWQNRKARLQRVMFTSEGPTMGGGVGQPGGIEAFIGTDHGHDNQSQKKHGLRGLKAFMEKLRDEL